MATDARVLRLVGAPRGGSAEGGDVPPEARPPEPNAPPVDLGTAFRSYGRYVGWIAMRILGRPEDVDDVVQDVFLDAVRGIERLRDPSSAKAWLATLTVRKARRVLRKRKLRRFLGLDEGAEYGDIVDPAASSAQRVLVADLYRMLDTLSTDERLAWTLRHLEQEPLERVAELCGCSLATAKRRIAAAHATLGGELGDV